MFLKYMIGKFTVTCSLMLLEYNFMFFSASSMCSFDLLCTDNMLNVKRLNFVVL